ncbi:regulatory protein spx [Bacilli bacterium PM5-3]|nr:regulatory protein spx [Bacilli bacterium PM5-3]MDH6603642.1 regulatory protein spx [Bacilli bacterium PM5-9]
MSVKVYTSPSCASCRKAKRWLTNFGIEFVEKNIFVSKLSKEELKAILEKTEHGFEDIISTRSKVFKEKAVDIENMSINELLEFIEANPSVLKRPIIIDDRRLQIGYNDEEIRVFIPRELRQHFCCEGCGYEKVDENGECGQKEKCPNYEEDNQAIL